MPKDFELPCGIKTPDGKFTKVVTLDEITGREEDILHDQTIAAGGKGKLKRSSSMRISEVLSRCTVAIGDFTRPVGKDRKNAPNYFLDLWKKAFLGDRGFMVIRLREMSLGSSFIFPENCPRCKKIIERVVVDLASLEVRPMDPAVASGPTEMEVVTPSGIRVVWRALVGTDEEAISNVRENHPANLPTAVMRFRMISLDGEQATNESLADLTSSDRVFLRNHFDEVEGGIDTSVEIVCDNPECLHEFKRKLNLGHENFFFPSGRYSSLKETSQP